MFKATPGATNGFRRQAEKQNDAANFDPQTPYCPTCGCPTVACKGHYAHNHAPPQNSPSPSTVSPIK